jgi:ketosteroid isomerase-like protein
MQPTEKRTTISESILAAMRQTNALFDREVIAGKNIGALDRIYTRDAHVLPPGALMIEGREQIKNFWKQAIEAMALTNVNLTTVYAESAGDGVVEIGRADLALAGGQIVTVKYVVHWKQEDGIWKWNVDIWNPNQ